MRQTETENQNLMVGKTPEFESGYDVLTRFIYTFEMSFMTEAFDDKRDDIESWMLKQTQVLPYKWETLSKAQQWWGYLFIISKESAAYEGLNYAVTICESILANLETKEKDVLEQFANHYVYGLGSKTMKTPLVRPLEFKRLEVTMVGDIFAELLMKKLPELSKYLKKHYLQRDINEDFMKAIWLSNKKYIRKYSSVWNAFAEVNINIIFVLYEIALDDLRETTKADREIILKEVIEDTFGASLLEVEINKLTDYCLELLLEVTHEKSIG